MSKTDNYFISEQKETCSCGAKCFRVIYEIWKNRRDPSSDGHGCPGEKHIGIIYDLNDANKVCKLLNQEVINP